MFKILKWKWKSNKPKIIHKISKNWIYQLWICRIEGFLRGCRLIASKLQRFFMRSSRRVYIGFGPRVGCLAAKGSLLRTKHWSLSIRRRWQMHTGGTAKRCNRRPQRRPWSLLPRRWSARARSTLVCHPSRSRRRATLFPRACFFWICHLLSFLNPSWIFSRSAWLLGFHIDKVMVVEGAKEWELFSDCYAVWGTRDYFYCYFVITEWWNKRKTRFFIEWGHEGCE